MRIQRALLHLPTIWQVTAAMVHLTNVCKHLNKTDKCQNLQHMMQTNRRSVHESQQQVWPASAAAAADVSVSDAEERLAGDVGGPIIRS